MTLAIKYLKEASQYQFSEAKKKQPPDIASICPLCKDKITDAYHAIKCKKG